jgi:hypothetical protein
MEENHSQKKLSNKINSNYLIVLILEKNIQIVNQSKKSEIKQTVVPAGPLELLKP